MSVGKEWEIPLRQKQKFCPQNCFLGMVALKMPIEIICATWGLFPGTVTYMYSYYNVYGQKLNRTLAIDSSFQTFAVGLLVEFID